MTEHDLPTWITVGGVSVQPLAILLGTPGLVVDSDRLKLRLDKVEI